jgi:transcriptional regulator GlxA family with amidase domain
VKTTFLLFDGFAALDVIGGYEVLANLPGMEIEFVAARPGLVATDTRCTALPAFRGLDEVGATDVLYVPGGPGDQAVMDDAKHLDWIRAVHATTTWTTAVCTGGLILGAAGLLEGVEATTNWTRLERLAGYGAQPVSKRFVESGKIMTAAGVSASIDLGLHLAARIGGERIAQIIQLALEYDPAPPFDVGSPEKAPPDVRSFVSENVEALTSRRMQERTLPRLP